MFTPRCKFCLLFVLGLLLFACKEEKIITPFSTSYRFATWNIAHFNLGPGTENMINTVEKYETFLPIYKRIIDSVKADFISVCEFEKVFFAGHNDCLTQEKLFPKYGYFHDDILPIAYFSHIPIENTRVVKFSDYPDGADRYYLYGNITLGEKEISVVCTHLTHSTPNVYAPKQMEQLVRDFADAPYVIMLADWNSGPADFELLINAGYTLANAGPHWLQTYCNTEYYNGVMDNIAVKGGMIVGKNVINTNSLAGSFLSDHYLLYCDIVF